LQLLTTSASTAIIKSTRLNYTNNKFLHCADTNCEVVVLNSDLIWQAFSDTGDPMYYLLYKAASEKEEKHKRDAENGETPRASD